MSVVLQDGHYVHVEDVPLTVEERRCQLEITQPSEYFHSTTTPNLWQVRGKRKASAPKFHILGEGETAALAVEMARTNPIQGRW